MTNLAYLCNLMERPSATLDWLEKAVVAGWRDVAVLAGGCADLADEPRYERQLHQVRELVAASGVAAED